MHCLQFLPAITTILLVFAPECGKGCHPGNTPAAASDGSAAAASGGGSAAPASGPAPPPDSSSGGSGTAAAAPSTGGAGCMSCKPEQLTAMGLPEVQACPPPNGPGGACLNGQPVPGEPTVIAVLATGVSPTPLIPGTQPGTGCLTLTTNCPKGQAGVGLGQITVIHVERLDTTAAVGGDWGVAESYTFLCNQNGEWVLADGVSNAPGGEWRPGLCRPAQTPTTANCEVTSHTCATAQPGTGK